MCAGCGDPQSQSSLTGRVFVQASNMTLLPRGSHHPRGETHRLRPAASSPPVRAPSLLALARPCETQFLLCVPFHTQGQIRKQVYTTSNLLYGKCRFGVRWQHSRLGGCKVRRLVKFLEIPGIPTQVAAFTPRQQKALWCGISSLWFL